MQEHFLQLIQKWIVHGNHIQIKLLHGLVMLAEGKLAGTLHQYRLTP